MTDNMEKTNEYLKLHNVPRLERGDDYATWAPLFLNCLAKASIEGGLREIKNWKELSEMTKVWDSEEVDRSIAHVMGMSFVSSSSNSLSGPSESPVKKENFGKKKKEENELDPAHKTIVQKLIIQSKQVYSLLFSALGVDIRAQVICPAGYGFALWKWLETKFQSTEADNVYSLWRQWSEIKMEKEERYDTYRVRVSRLRALLTSAKEIISPTLFTFVSLERLHPRFNPVVLALKTNGSLKDAARINWDEIATLMNSVERSEERIDLTDDDQHAYSSRESNRNSGAATNKYGKKIDLDKIRCYKCNEPGHYSTNCEGRAGKKQQDEVAHSMFRTGGARTGGKDDDDNYWDVLNGGDYMDM